MPASWSQATVVLAGLIAVAQVQACLDWGALENGACGDGFVGREEACDDGNRIPGDGCNDACQAEPPYCGDGRLDAGEDCDDANDLDADACVAGCRLAECGDGLLWELEERCDDGNAKSNDGCSATCEMEMALEPPRCGDGRLQDDEACDDGNDSDEDGCLSGCSWATCGDGRVRRGVEECDDPSPDSECNGCLLCVRDGWYFRRSNGHCYTLHEEPLSQADARRACQEEGGDLWTTTSQAESNELAMKLGLTGRQWLGLTVASNGVHSWVTGERTMFTAFAPDEPRPAVSCVAFDAPAGKWSSEVCTTALPFVCERGSAFVALGDHHAYRLYTQPLTHAAARERCTEAGGQLCSLETDEERLFVGRQVGLATWLDASEISEGVFAWPDGSPVNPTSWMPDQPDDLDGSQSCMIMTAGDRYADAKCGEARPYVCEFE